MPRTRPAVERLEDRSAPAVFTVTTLADDPSTAPPGSLREALEKANNEQLFPGPDTVVFAPGLAGTIPLTRTLDVTSSVTVQGPAAGGVTVSGGGQVRVFEVVGSDNVVRFENLTIADGKVLFSDGAGIRNSADLFLVNVTVANNEAAGGSGPAFGGGVSNASALTVTDSRFLNNRATGDSFFPGAGGGVFNTGDVFITRTEFRGNRAPEGGAVANAPSSFGGPTFRVLTSLSTIDQSLFAGNTATGAGGAIVNRSEAAAGPTLTVTNTTFAGNTAGAQGGAVAAFAADSGIGGANTRLVNVTVSGNAAADGGGVFSFAAASGDASLALRNSVIAGNADTDPANGLTPDVSGPLAESGNNVIGNAAGGSGYAATDRLGVDPRLGPLAANGGPTATFALLAGSPAIGLADPAIAPAVDQRGFPRPAGGPIDAGAYQTQPPVGAADTFTATAGRVLTVPAPGVLANDADPDASGGLQAVLVTPPPAGAGAVELFPDGSFRFTPAAGFVGMASFAYRPTDGVVAGAAVTVTVNVTNQPPVANPDAFTTLARTPLDVPAAGVLANDADPDGHPLAAVLVTAPPPIQGSVILNPDGSFRFTPAPGFAGPASFAYRASDGIAAGNTTTVTVTVTNRPPVAVADEFATRRGQPLDVAAPGLLGNDADPDGHPVTAVVDAHMPPAQGVVTLNPDGSFRYTPAAGFVGTASFTYRATDGVEPSPPVAVTIAVGNRPPAAAPDGPFSAVVGQTLTIPAPGLLANDADPDGDPLAAVLVQGPPAAAGTFAFNPDGSFTFTPAAAGQTITFTYAASDGTALSGPASVTVAVPPLPVGPPPPLPPGNRPPVAAADGPYTTTTGQGLAVAAAGGVLANDADPDGDPLRAEVVAPPDPVAGAVALHPDGAFEFHPTAGFVGTATFTYRALDGRGGASEPTPVTVRVAPRTDRLYAVAAGAGGGPRVRVFDAATHAERFDFYAFEPTFDGGVRVAVGDVTGDGADDVVVAAGFTGGPRVRAFDGVTGAPVADFFAYEADYRGGVFVAVGDVTGDGRADIITGPGSGAAPRVRVFRGRSFAAADFAEFLAYDPAFRGGVRVAAGDLTADGFAEVVTGAGPSGGPHVAVRDGKTGAELESFFAYEPGYRGGVFVGVAPVGGLGLSGGVVVTGPDNFPGFAGSVLDAQFPALPDTANKAFGRPATAADLARRPEIVAFRVSGGRVIDAEEYDPAFGEGVRVAAGDVFGPAALVIAGPGVGGDSRVRVYRLEGDGSIGGLVREFDAFEPAFRGSVYVGG